MLFVSVDKYPSKKVTFGMYEPAKNELKENNKVLVIYLMLTLAGYFSKHERNTSCHPSC